MHQPSISAPVYVVVLCVLLVLTVLTVAASFLELAGGWHILIGMLIGTCKASLVVLFFMHALVSPKLTWLIIGVSILWLGILMVLTFADYLTRGMIPYMPGH